MYKLETTKYKHIHHTPPGLLAQVVPGLLSDLQLRGSSPCTCINNYLAKKKRKTYTSHTVGVLLLEHLIPSVSLNIPKPHCHSLSLHSTFYLCLLFEPLAKKCAPSFFSFWVLFFFFF